MILLHFTEWLRLEWRCLRILLRRRAGRRIVVIPDSKFFQN